MQAKIPARQFAGAKRPAQPGKLANARGNRCGEVSVTKGRFLGLAHAMYGLFYSWLATGEIVKADSLFLATLYWMAALFNIVQIPAGFGLLLGKPWAPRFIISTMEGYVAIMVVPFIVGLADPALVGSYDQLITGHSTLLIWPMIIILLLGNSSREEAGGNLSATG